MLTLLCVSQNTHIVQTLGSCWPARTISNRTD